MPAAQTDLGWVTEEGTATEGRAGWHGGVSFPGHRDAHTPQQWMVFPQQGGHMGAPLCQAAHTAAGPGKGPCCHPGHGGGDWELCDPWCWSSCWGHCHSPELCCLLSRGLQPPELPGAVVLWLCPLQKQEAQLDLGTAASWVLEASALRGARSFLALAQSLSAAAAAADVLTKTFTTNSFPTPLSAGVQGTVPTLPRCGHRLQVMGLMAALFYSLP